MHVVCSTVYIHILYILSSSGVYTRTQYIYIYIFIYIYIIAAYLLAAFFVFSTGDLNLIN